LRKLASVNEFSYNVAQNIGKEFNMKHLSFFVLLMLFVTVGVSNTQAKGKAKKPIENIAEDLEHFGQLIVDLKTANKNARKKIVSEICKKGLGHESATIFVFCFKALKRSNNEEIYSAVAAFVKKKKSKNPYVIGAGLNIVRQSKNPANWEACLPHLKSKNRGIGVMAAELAGQGLRKAVPDLMSMLGKIDMRRLTVTLGVLNYLTGQKFNLTPTYFKNWWDSNKKDFDKTPILRKTKKPLEYFQIKRTSGSSYHGQKLDMANTFFCMDTSLSMQPDAPIKRPKKEKGYFKKNNSFPKLPDGNGSKIWEARRELATAIKNLSSRMSFGIVTFGGRIDAYNMGKLQKAKEKKNLVEAYKWVLYDTPLSWGTWLFQSVAIALQNPDTEVIYLLTDGAPTSAPSRTGVGNIKMDATHDLRQAKYFNATYIENLAFREFNYRRVIIHSILVGNDGAANKGKPLLKSISKVTHGDFKQISVKKANKKDDKKKKPAK